MTALGWLLAACSSAATPSASAAAPFIPDGRIDAKRLLELQAQGRLYTPLSHERVLRMLSGSGASRPKLAAVKRAVQPVALWATVTQDSDLLGQSKKLFKTATVIDTQANQCVYPVTVKVDASQNVWVGCEYNGSDNDGVYQEYSKNGTLSATYQDGCPAPVSGCGEFYSESTDGASNANYVFDGLSYYYAGLNCNPSCTYSYGGGFEYWKVGGSSSAPTLIPLTFGQPVYGVAYMDLDKSGDIWFDYYGCNSASSCGDGIAEITTPTTNPTFVAIKPPGFLQCAGGVYASAKSTTINVIDSCTRLIYQFTGSGSNSGKIGPIGHLGHPISGSFNATDTRIAIGDEKGWLDVGNLQKNQWNTVVNPYFRDGLMGAAYAQSDK